MADASTTCLNLNYRTIGDEEMKRLCGLSSLTTLFVRNNRITDEGLRPIRTNTTISTLSVSDNLLTKYCGKFVAHNTVITALDLAGNKLRDEGVVDLAQNSTITNLDISYNVVVREGIEAVARCSSLRKLAIGSCGGGDYELSQPAMNALVGNTTITRLELDGYSDFAEMLVSTNSTVQDLSFLSVVGEGLTQALANNTSITKMSFLEMNCFEELHKWTNLKDLRIQTMWIDYDGVQTLTTNTSLLSLRIEGGIIATPDAIEALYDCTTLMEIGHYGDCDERLRQCAAQNRQRVKDSSRIFIMACGLSFGLKKAIRKRLYL